jgi:hypothetical protein
MEGQPLPTGGKLEHLFTKKLDSRGHARDFTLLGDSNDRDKILKEEFE